MQTWHLLAKSHGVVGIPHIKQRKMGTMLTQGQAFSAKRGRLAVVNSGLIFLKKKKRKKSAIYFTIVGIPLKLTLKIG